MSGAVELSTPVGLVRSSTFEPGATIHELIELHDIPVSRQPVVCILNGTPVLRKDWGLVVSSHDQIQFIALPQGKQTGGLKGILRLVALVALAVVAPYAAGVIGGLVGVTSGIGLGLIQAGITVAGAFLINALLSPKLPGAKGDSETSPTYSITAQGNSARLLQPIPRLYGRHVIFPDFASQPFADYASNEQYLYQLFCLGVGEYDVEQVRIEETVLWRKAGGYTNNFDDVKIEIVPPGQSVTLIPLEIVTSSEVSGQELKNITASGTYSFAGNTITRTGGGDFSNLVPGDMVVITGAGLNNGTRVITSVPSANSLIVGGLPFDTFSGSKTIALDNWVGPYVAVPAGQVADRLSIDYVFPQGLGYANDDGGISSSSIGVEVQARAIDNLGNPIGDFVTLDNRTYTRKTSTPQRATDSYDVTPARYEVRLRRTTPRNYSNRYLHIVQWGGLRASIPDDATYDDVTLLAVKMRATDQLTQQSARKFNVIQTAKVPVWNGTSWSAPQPTRSIAWAAADALRNNVYGGDTPDSRIDLDKLLALDATWTARGDHFDGVFDSKRSLWDAVSTVLRAGRAQPVMVAGVVTFVRDEPRSVARAIFTPRNMVKNSFESTVVLYDEDSPDDVIVEYVDERTWKQTEVQCTLPGSLSKAPARIQMFGVVDRAHAWREGMYQAASNAYRRKFAKLTSELDGRVLIKGDPVIISHDVPMWSQSGEVLALDVGDRELTLSEVPSFKDGEDHHIALRRPDGKEFGPILCTPHQDYDDVVVLDAADLAMAESAAGRTLSQVVNLSTDREPTLYVFGVGVGDIRRFLLATGTPRGLDQIDLTMVNDDPRVYSADAGSPPAEALPIGPGAVPNAPIATGLNVVQDPNSPANPVTVNAAWPAAAGASTYVLQVSYDNVVWSTLYSGSGTTVQVIIQPGVVYFRLAGVNVFRGPWALFSGSFGSAVSGPATVSGLTATASPSEGTVEISYVAGARATSYRIDLYRQATPGTGPYSVLALSRTVEATSLQLTSSDITSAGGPWSSFQVQVTSINASGESLPALFTVGGYSLATPTGLALVSPYVGAELLVQWDAVSNATSYEVQLYARGTLLAQLNVTSTAATFTNAMLVSYGGPFRSMEIRVRAKASGLSGLQASVTAGIAGIVSLWDFESGGTDAVGTSNLTITGATVVSIGGLLGNVYRGAATTNRATSAAALAASYTKAAWINPANLTGEKHVASGPNTSNTTAHALRLSGALVQAGHGANLAYVASSAITAGSWYHVAVTYDAPSTTMKLYVNGALVATNSAVPALTAGQPLTVGNVGANTLGFVGDIDEVQLYSRALTATEVAAILR